MSYAAHDLIPSVPAGGATNTAPGQAAHLSERAWIQNVETGVVKATNSAELEQLRSPWKRITAAQAAFELREIYRRSR